MKKFCLLFLLGSSIAQAQEKPVLTVESIMRDQKWLGVSPSDYHWSGDSKTIYFKWNPESKDNNESYKVDISAGKPVKTTEKLADQESIGDYTYNKDHSLGLIEKSGDLFLYAFKTKQQRRLTNTIEAERNAVFLNDGTIAFQKGNNLYALNLNTSELKQLTNFVSGKKAPVVKNTQDNWLKTEQDGLFEVIKSKKKQEAFRLAKKKSLSGEDKPLRAIELGNQQLSNLVISPDGRYINYRLKLQAGEGRETIVPNFVTASGYTEDIPGRTKVGEPLPVYENFIYDQQRDTVYKIQLTNIPGIKDLPDYLKDYPKEQEAAVKKNEDRKVNLSAPIWNTAGTMAVLTAESQDNKDRWILKLDAATGGLTLLDRQRDEAWIGGPGINSDNLGWTDNQHIYFQSEASGYAHVYVADVSTGVKRQLTSGKWEVKNLSLSKDKQTFYFTGNIEHPGITHFYKVSVNGGTPVKITSMKGGNEVTLSPDEKWLAINYSYMNKPWELYIQANKPGAKAIRVTESSSAAFKAYPWREPDLVSFKNRYGDDVYARVYPASKPAANHPAVVFVHGAGYLQNVHYWWSQYSREYMFHNLLADNGYTVIDIDYTASSGYGRNHRTGIYRHMGGKDLTDQVDGIKMLVEKYQVNPQHVGIYGGSYGGFITLMALFNEPGVFASGAALRSVTDWAHYNHGYTSNILNEPANDSLAYRRSSPIYFAEGLKGDLLMCHGMVDENVQFQDIVRLSQRLIELGKNHWDLAVYPVEDHGFVQPSSWTDEYKRIFKLFERTLKN
ncbi:S9 family peptidase [Pedobacter cryoconitis]|uniref:S9 family peptidase n=1 Tax=Pedobacter cryoconitis TaxID=188932 RepID=UPI00161A36DE|nr:prolyl oligopeptidase family serine peptidase [Pedobacter cryoconitis]MBB5648575.1 dipeptidyl aminopeptidase/acylaminoacyl peptidase [Pedobacter cryoconitis]